MLAQCGACFAGPPVQRVHSREGPQICCCKSLLTRVATVLSITTTASAIDPGIPSTTSA